MSKHEEFLKRLLSGQAGANIGFDELRSLLKQQGFDERIRGNHAIFTKDTIVEIINLQPVKAKAKPYQVRQVAKLIRKYHLNRENE